MMTRSRPAARALTVLVLLTPGAAVAQIPSRAAGSSTVSTPSSWLWSTTAEQGYDSNVRYVAEEDPDRVTRLRTSLSIRRQGARGQLSLLGNGDLVRYATNRGLNMFAYDVELGGARRMTPRVTTTGTVFYRTQLTTSVFGVGALPLLALANQRAVGGTASAERRFTPTTTGKLNVAYASLTFDTPQLLPGTALTARALITHQYRPKGAVLLSLDGEDGISNGIPLTLQTAAAGWSAYVGGRQLQLLSGATHISAGGKPRWIATGQAQVSDSLGRGVWTIGFTRNASQAFGLGQLLTTNAATAAYDFQARRGNYVRLGASLADSRESTGVGSRFQSSGVTADIRRVLLSGVTFGWGLSYRQRKDISEATGFATQAQFGYSLGSR